MKRTLTLILAAVLALSLAACGGTGSGAPQAADISSAAAESTAAESGSGELTPITVAASPTPHAEILAVAKDLLAKEGYDLQVTEFVDYIQPNMVVENGDILCNYFQHQPYLDDFNAEKGTHLVSVAAVHYEPLGIYPGKTATLDALKDGAKIAVPNDTTNESRALLLLESNGLIKLKEGAGLKATKNDIAENPKKFEIVELEAAQLARSLQDVDIAVINGNYAIQAGLNVSKDALAKEEKDSLAATTYANILVVKQGNETDPRVKALSAALQSAEVKKFIEDKYQGAVVPMF